VVTISLKKVTAGSGYDYLTRQVAAQDGLVRTGLAAYYEEKGEAPGVWMGSGLEGLDGIADGDPVTEAQMKALFGNGHHPLADQIRQAALDAGMSEREAEKACRLGRPFAVRTNGSPEFHQELKRRHIAANVAAGRPANTKLDPDQLAQIRSEVASEFFAREFGRAPETPLELHRAVTIWSRPVAATIAGVDLTVSPTKSFSTLWALAPLATSRQLEELHRQAVAKVVEYLETQAFSRVGPHGVRNVETRGLVAVAFTHRDSRAGDPDLHTHLVIANKVQSTDGRWYALNTNLIYKAKVAASELYSATLEASLAETFGIRFVERSTGAGRRPVREIDGVDLALAARWSTRRGQIEHRRDELAAAFLNDHGRPPTEAEMIALAQRANLETREAKHEPRSLAEQRATWREQAELALGIGGVDRMLATVFNRPAVAPKTPSIDWLIDTSARVIGVLESERSTWQSWHVRAEALRQTRAAGVPAELLDRVVDTIVDLALETRSIRLSVDDPIQEPDALRRSDGQSVYTIPGVDWYTSSRILAAEQRIVANAGRTDGRAVDPSLVDLAQLEALANGTQLTSGQSDLVREMACSGRRVQLAVAAAGTGKTTAMRVLGSAWTESGGTVIGLAPSAAAAKALADQLDVPCETLAKLTWSLDHPEQQAPAWMAAIGPKSLAIIDEAGMADTLSLDRAIAEVLVRGGNVRLIGDDRQLSAIGAGGVLRDIEAEHGACRLTEILRFDDPAEAAASTALREGRAESLGYYLDHDRIHVGDLVTMAHAVLDAWAQDRADGLDALMLAPTRELVTQLNRLAQQRHHEGHTMIGRGAGLADHNIAVAGDLVITRHNDRRLPVGSRDWVKNGDRWRVASVSADGSLRVQSLRSKHAVTLPADYVRDWVDLGYATTIHGAQGLTADTMHGLTTGEESREQLYTMLTRGRQANHVYLQVVGDGDPHGLAHTDSVYLLTGVERLERILAPDDAPLSASTELREQGNPARLLAPAVARYTDALGVAAEQVVGADAVRRLDDEADQVVLWLTECPAWETLRADLLGLAADGHDPVALLRQAANMDELDTARDPAAVLDYRLQLLVPEKVPGPLPWLRGIPSRVAEDEGWGPYLQARADRIEGLADAVRREVRSHRLPPSWLGVMPTSPRMFENGVLIGDIAVWRAVMEVPTSDARATGAPAMGDAAARWQRDLDTRLDRALGTGQWGRLLPTLDPALAQDPERLVIARRLHRLGEKGLDVGDLIERALGEGPLPNERPASALWWRVAGIARVWQGWPPPRRTEDVWETVTQPPRRRPEHEHLPGYGHDRHGPSIGF
jgi:conjugative relaxase-like TrwC/TraI family protein